VLCDGRSRKLETRFAGACWAIGRWDDVLWSKSLVCQSENAELQRDKSGTLASNIDIRIGEPHGETGTSYGGNPK